MADTFRVASNGHFLLSDPDDGPDVGGGGEGKDETGEQDHRTGPLELSMLLVIKVSHGAFSKESDGQKHVQRGKDHVIDNGFDLSSSILPGAFHHRAHIAPAAGRGESGNAEDGHHHQGKEQGPQMFFEFSHKYLPKAGGPSRRTALSIITWFSNQYPVLGRGLPGL